MTISDSNLYADLNQRARAYSGQLWYVPFAYVGLAGAVLAVLDKVPVDYRGGVLILFGFFSLAVFIHVTGLKYYERKAVRKMRALEGWGATTSGGSRWFLNYTWYIRVFLAISALGFFSAGAAVYFGKVGAVVAPSVLVACLVAIAYEDCKRNKLLIASIRD